MRSWGEPEPDPRVVIERPRLTFADVGGMDAVKEEIQIQIKIIHPINHPEIFKAYGKKTGGGILLHGAPGCGKTHMARAFIFHRRNLHDKAIASPWIGNILASRQPTY